MRASRLVTVLVPIALSSPALSGCDDCTRLELASDGPGDAEGFYPLAVGDRWVYEESAGPAGVPRVSFSSELAVTEERPSGTAALTRLLSRRLDGRGEPSEEVIWNGPAGVTVYASDREPAGSLPLVRLRWPLATGDAYSAYECFRYDEEVTIDVAVGGDEEVTVPAGTFTARKVTTRVVDSGSDGGSVTEDESWYAPRVGRVRSSRTTTWSGASEPIVHVRALSSYSSSNR